MSYTTQEVSALYSVTIETARTWAKEFADYLSPTANPGHNKTRQFSIEDMQVFSLVRQLRNEGRTMEEIHVALQNGERGREPELDSGDVRAIVAQEAEKRWQMQLGIYEERIRALQGEVETLTQKASRSDELEKKIAELEGQIRLLEERAKMQYELGERDGELKALRKLLEDRSK